MKAIDRIYKYLEYKGVKPGTFEKQIGLSSGYLSKQHARNADVGESIMIRIVENCPELNFWWLLTGSGEMLKKKSENFSEENSSPELKPKTQAQTHQLKPRTQVQKQYDPNDGQAREFGEGGWSDAQQIEVLNRHISAQNKVIATKNDLIRTKDELLASKDELLASKDQTITAQTASLKLLEGQINATTALIEQLTLFLGNDAKKRPERADARDASDVGAR